MPSDHTLIGLFGSTGYVGSRFRAYLEREGVAWTPIRRPAAADARAYRDALIDAGVDFVINCAGFTGKTKVDACETQKAACLMGNAVLPGLIREACEDLGIPWGHVSSGCIYSGRRPGGAGFREEDPPNFSFRQNYCSYYSGTKALGEEILAGASQCYVWRLRIPFDDTTSPRNYLQKLLTYDRLLEAENSLSHLDEFVAACVECFRRNVPYGVYNLTNPGSVWTSDVTALMQELGVTDRQFKFFDNEAQFMAQAAKTPRSNCVLDSSKALASGLQLSPVKEAIARCLQAWATSRDQSPLPRREGTGEEFPAVVGATES
jgi:dTDP-4-dehydrorhamnose reductase